MNQHGDNCVWIAAYYNDLEVSYSQEFYMKYIFYIDNEEND